ncbi:MAG: NAD(P)-dependent oxidoreductase [Planctomycetes bacterium]|nr:NAD(P)-dependent oxidoreductase [Planctomycetota bacterium]
MPSTVLVTGGAGFIGTWVLRELLARGMQPVVLDVCRNDARWQSILGPQKDQVTFVQGGLLDRPLLQQTLARHAISHVIHLAALLTPQCQQDPWTGCEVNILGSVALFEAARALPGQIQGISYASSFAVYGPEADDSELGVSAAQNRPPSFYGAYKMAVDLIAEQYARHFSISSVGIRPHVVYGPERTVGLTAGPSLAARAAARGEAFTINYTGRLGYDYVEDVARAFVRSALETPPGWAVVDLPGQVATTQDFIDVIDRIVPGAGARLSVDGPAVPANIPPRPRYISKLFPDWRATTLTEGIQATVDFYRRGT